MNAKSLIIMFIALNSAGIIVGMLITNDVLFIGHQNVMPYDPETVANQFNLLTFSTANVVSGIIGGLVGVIGLITRQGTFAIYAILIWIIGTFLGIFSWVFSGFGKMLDILIPAELNPTVVNILGVDIGITSAIIWTFILITFYFALAGVAAQRTDLG
jgi:hypothetical protein